MFNFLNEQRAHSDFIQIAGGISETEVRLADPF